MHDIRQRRHRLGGLQFRIQRPRRLAEQDRQAVHRLPLLRLILRQLCFKVAQLRPRIFYVHLRRQPAPLATFGQIQRLLRTFNLGVQRGNNALRPAQLEPGARHFGFKGDQRVVTLLNSGFLLRFSSFNLTANFTPEINLPLGVEAALVEVDRLPQRP